MSHHINDEPEGAIFARRRNPKERSTYDPKPEFDTCARFEAFITQVTRIKSGQPEQGRPANRAREAAVDYRSWMLRGCGLTVSRVNLFSSHDALCPNQIMKAPHPPSYYHWADSSDLPAIPIEPARPQPTGQIAITAFFEISGPFQLRPRYFKAPFGRGHFRRFIWLWFACGWVPYRMDQWHDRIASGTVVWVDE